MWQSCSCFTCVLVQSLQVKMHLLSLFHICIGRKTVNQIHNFLMTKLWHFLLRKNKIQCEKPVETKHFVQHSTWFSFINLFIRLSNNNCTATLPEDHCYKKHIGNSATDVWNITGKLPFHQAKFRVFSQEVLDLILCCRYSTSNYVFTLIWHRCVTSGKLYRMTLNFNWWIWRKWDTKGSKLCSNLNLQAFPWQYVNSFINNNCHNWQLAWDHHWLILDRPSTLNNTQ